MIRYSSAKLEKIAGSLKPFFEIQLVIDIDSRSNRVDESEKKKERSKEEKGKVRGGFTDGSLEEGLGNRECILLSVYSRINNLNDDCCRVQWT